MAAPAVSLTDGLLRVGHDLVELMRRK